MSANADIPVVEMAAAPPDPGTLRGMFQSPTVRNYLFAGLAAQVMIFLIMFASNSDLGGLLLAVLGSAGMIFRWPAVPSFFLLILTWFLIFPFGLPPAYENSFELRNGHLRVADVLLAFSVVVYLASFYRIFGLTTQAMPTERRVSRKKPKPTRRPLEMIRAGEIPRLLCLTFGVVIAGQLIWLLLTSLEIDVTAEFPLTRAEALPRGRKRPPEELSLWQTRLLVLLGIGFFGTLLARLIFGYWKLRLMSAAEGGMMLQDAGWDETRRERTRVEKWRLWGKAKTATDGKPEKGPMP